MTQLNENEKQLIINDYLNGVSVHQLKSKYHHSDTLIKNILTEANCYLGRNYSKQRLKNKELELTIVNEYNNGVSLQKISEKYHLHKELIKTILRDHGIKPRSLEEQLQYSNRKYFVNEEYFYNDNSDVWYLAGFIAADGNIAKYSNSLDIQLAQKDVILLQTIKEKLNYTGEVKIFTTQHGDDKCRLTITNKKLVQSLERFNITKNKTFIYQMPQIPDKYIGDFLRGYFDGDGWISTNGNQISIVSASKAFAENLKQLYSKYGLEYKEYIDNRKINPLYDIRILKKDELKKFYFLIYNDSENKIFLKRKKERFQSLFE